jgi:hypothetical protein
MSHNAKKQYTAVIVQLDHAGKTIDEMPPISASTPEEAVDQARVWARKECARRGIGQARLSVHEDGEIKPIHNELVF